MGIAGQAMMMTRPEGTPGWVWAAALSVAVVVLAAGLGAWTWRRRHRPPEPAVAANVAGPRLMLDERFARGELSEADYLSGCSLLETR